MNNKLKLNTLLLRKESEFLTKSCVVEKAIAVSHAEFENLKRHPLQDNELIAENADLMCCDSDDIYHCLLIYDEVRKEYSKLGLVGEKQCTQSDKPQDYERKLLILKPEILNEQFKNPINQYFYVTRGFGCDPEKSGRKVFGQFIADGEKAHFYREDFYGVADYDRLPKWAVERLEQIEAPQMKIRIFQIDHNKDCNKLAFMNYDYVQSYGDVKAENYRQIYGGTVNCDSLESVFALCNSDKTPPGYFGNVIKLTHPE